MKHKPVYTISFKGANDYEANEQEVLIRELSQLNLYGTQFAYTAFSPEKLKKVLREGTPHDVNTIDCCIVNALYRHKPGIHHDDNSDLVYYMALLTSRPSAFAAFAVYDLSKLEVLKTHPHYFFKIPEKKQDALLAVIKVKDFFE